MSDTYDTFIAAVREIGQLGTIESLLDWDSETYMPPNGLAIRAEQLALLASLAHQRLADPRLADLLSRLDGTVADAVQLTNVREMRRLHDRAVKIPDEIVRRIARVTTIAKDVWAKAREKSNFPRFAPHLAELLDLKRQVADLIGHDGDRYDPLLDEFEPGARTADIAELFASLREPLSAFARQLTESKRQPDVSLLHRRFPKEAQRRLARRLAEAIGFDFSSGRVDVSTHPFCSGAGPGDVRFTTRYCEDFFNAAIFGVLHEAGHGLYEQGLDSKHLFTPMGQAVSLGIHESQSRMWENLVGRSRAFWELFYPECQREFAGALGGVSMDDFYSAINAVGPSPIRVEADEVTYNLHIILRFELERAMIDGSLAVEDIPEAWNAKMRDLLGITPDNDAEGCLQDIHWSHGTFGYFPTYALGNLYAAQFYAAAERAIPDMTDRLRRGDLATLLEWLRANIHRHGERYRANELVREVTGEPLSIEPFVRYIRAKYSQIYGL
ncbi:MAG: carboxypeptidase M32 [Phycisphaerae bacterium]|nr:carboxypeptidase M32 [Phycisphaerae bacterium]